MTNENIFQIRDVSKTYATREGRNFQAVNQVSLDLKRGVAYALVGESGSGKTTLGRLLAGLMAPSAGEILFEGKNLAGWVRTERRFFCKKVQIVFQNPYLSLDPKWSLREILEEGIQSDSAIHKKKKIKAILERVRLPVACLGKRPYALSGGERQRIAIARALIMDPEYLILDEPTSQLDVSAQAGIFQLLKDLRPVLTGGLLFITHDIALASQWAETFIVMQCGKIVETGLKNEVLVSSQKPYVRELISAVFAWPPILNRSGRKD